MEEIIDHPVAEVAELAEIAELLKAVRAAMAPLARDPRLQQWQQVNFDKHGDLLRSYGLTADLKKARDQALAGIRTVLHELAKLENEYGDLAIDVQRRAIKPAAAQAAARRIKAQAELLEPPLRELETHCRTMFEGREQLLRLLSLPGLLTDTKEKSKIDPAEMDHGLRFFLFITNEQARDKSLSLAQVTAQAIALEQKFRQLEFAGLPPVASAILEQQRLLGLLATDQLKAYIEDFQKYPPNEIKIMQDFREQLKKLRSQELTTIIDQLPATSARFGNILFDLANRARNLRQISLMPHFLGKIKLLHDALAQTLPPVLREQTTDPGNPLNPERLAAENSADFFMGLRGVMLTFKMLFQSLGGSKVITTAELHDKSVEILKSCTCHHGKSEADRARLRFFLEEKLAEYGKPFPFELLAEHMKKIIFTYGSRMEQAILAHPIPDWAGSANGNGKGKGKDDEQADTNLGQLVKKIEIWTERFEVV